MMITRKAEELQKVITKTKGQRKVKISAYMLASSIINTPISIIKNKGYINIPLGKDKELSIDLTTREVIYFDYETGEETYLDQIVLQGQV